MRIAIIVTEDWYLCSHRLPIVRGAIAAGHEVMVLTHVADHAEPILATGARLVAIPLDRSSARPLAELRSVWTIARSLRRFRPDVVHNVALKPILYGTAGARLARARLTVNAMAGLGDVFMTDRGWGHRMLRRAIATSLRSRRSRALVQNPDDAAVMLQLGVKRDRIDVIRGAGVDLKTFTHEPPPPSPPVVVLYVGRLLDSKGIHELHAAAIRLRDFAPDVQMVVAGSRDPHNPGCIGAATLEQWEAEGVLKLLGHRSDVADLLRASHLVVLPSYREGVPKSLLEGAAAGRPLIATDVPGNREVVDHGRNGLLIPVGDVDELVAAILQLAEDAPRRASMGRASRSRAELEFSEDAVVAATLAIYDHACTPK